MRKINLLSRVLGGTLALFAIFAATAKAQDTSVAQQELTAQPINWNQLPAVGTFWLEGPNGFTAPYPCRPQYMAGASAYALSDDSFVVDARAVKNYTLLSMSSMSSSMAPPPPPTGGGHTNQSPKVNTLIVTSNQWFNKIVISNYTYVSLNSAMFDFNGNLLNYQFPAGVMYPVTSTNLTTPMARWQPVGQTNSIGNTNFSLPYNPAGSSHSFYRLCALLSTNIAVTNVTPFSVMATNIGVLTDDKVTLIWTNQQPGKASEDDTIVEMDTNGHSYLVTSVITTGATNACSFELTNVSGLTFVRYSASAAATTDQFFLPTNYYNNPDVITVPYVINTNSGRTIINVEAYDVTDASNPQLLANISGNGCQMGTLEIPGVSVFPGVDTIEFRATDSGFGQTATDFTISKYSLVSILSPIFTLVPNGTNRIVQGGGGYGIALNLVTTATNGTWIINTYTPAGVLFGTVTGAVASVGQEIFYDDGGTPSTVYPDPYYDVTVTVQPPTPQAKLAGQSNPPAPVQTSFIRVYIMPPAGNAGSIVGYDDQALPSKNSDRQTVLGVLGSLSGMFSDIYQVVDFGDGNWKTVTPPTTISLNQPPGLGWGWRALQAGLSGKSYIDNFPPTYEWTTQTPNCPILGVAVHGHGGVDPNEVTQGVQGPEGFSDSVVTKESLAGWGFNKASNAVAIAVFTGCKIGSGPFMQFILRNQGQPGHIPAVVSTAEHIRPCFGLAWTANVPISGEADQSGWISEWLLYAAAFNGGSSFTYSLDMSYALAQQNYYGNGGVYAVWSGTAGYTLDKYVQ